MPNFKLKFKIRKKTKNKIYFFCFFPNFNLKLGKNEKKLKTKEAERVRGERRLFNLKIKIRKKTKKNIFCFKGKKYKILGKKIKKRD